MRMSLVATWIPAVGLAAAVIVAGITVGLGLAQVTDRSGGLALSPLDDYPLRHLRPAGALAPMDDYWFRHAQTSAPLSPMDDFGVRHLTFEQ